MSTSINPTPSPTPSQPTTREDYSSGGIAYRSLDHTLPDGTRWEIALIATREGTRWQLPKGTVEAEETSVEAALREVEEETGLETQHEAFIETIHYWYWDTYRRGNNPQRVHKRVDFHLLGTTGGALSDESWEVDGVGWFTFAQALEIMTFKGEREIVVKAVELLKQM